MFDVGQGNGVLIKSAKAALIVDFGITGKITESIKKKKDYEGVILKKLSECLKDCEVSMVISHQDMDHFNLIGRILSLDVLEGKNLKFSLIGGKKDLKENIPDVNVKIEERTEKDHCHFIDFSNFCDLSLFTNLNDEIRNFLGDDVSLSFLYPILPTGKHEHDNNLIIRVDCYEESVLLTGDISAKLLSGINFYNPMALNASVVILPHHGSVASCESLIYDYSNLSSYRLLLISANPYTLGTILDQYALDSARTVLSRSGAPHFFCVTHEIPVINEDNKDPKKIKFVKENRDLPIFVTGNIDNKNSCFYKVNINAFGTVMYEGNKIMYAKMKEIKNYFLLLTDDIFDINDLYCTELFDKFLNFHMYLAFKNKLTLVHTKVGKRAFEYVSKCTDDFYEIIHSHSHEE